MENIDLAEEEQAEQIPYQDSVKQDNQQFALQIQGSESVDENFYSFKANDRLNFIRKVYGILSFQLLITCSICCLTTLNKSAQVFILNNLWLFWVAAITSIIVLIPVALLPNIAKSVPWNYIFLFTFTLSESWIVGCTCAFCEPMLVLTAAILTLGITIVLSLYACFTKNDFSTCFASMLVIIYLFLMFGIFMLIFGSSNSLQLFMSCIGVGIYGIYIIIDTQLIVGGRKIELTYDDYILGALMLYIDIIGMFIYILSILSKKN